MKNILILALLVVPLCQATQAQNRSTTTIRVNYGDQKIKDTTITSVADSGKADTVHIGMVTIIQCRDCGSEGKTSVSLGNQKKKNELTNVDFSWFGFDLGINSFVDKSAYGSPEVNDFVQLGSGHPEATEELFSLRGIKSVNVNIWPLLLKVNLVHHVLNLKTGIGIEMNNYRYTKNVTYVNETDKTHITLTDQTLKKNKLFTEYLTIPVLLNLNTNPHRNSRAFRLSAGPTFGLLIKSRTKQKSDAEGKVKNNDPFNLENFRTGARAEIGYGPINFYGAYSFTPIHKYGLEQYPFSIGIILNM